MVEVLRHSGMRSTTKVIFKNYLNSGAVYFETPDKSRQWIISLPDNASSRNGGEIVAELRRRLSGKNIVASDSELTKAAEAIKGTSIKHSDQFDIIEEVPDELIHSYEPYVSNNPHVNGPNSTVRNLRFTEWDSKFLENTKYGPACRLTYYYKPGYGANIPIDYYKGWTEPQIQNQIKSTIYGMFDKGTITITPGEIRKGATFVANKFREYEAKKANSRPYSTPNFSHSLFTVIPEGELYHHGILGMKWGVRRYQNEDGSLTPAGEKRYLKKVTKDMTKFTNAYQNAKTTEEKQKLIEAADSNAKRASRKAVAAGSIAAAYLGGVAKNSGDFYTEGQKAFDLVSDITNNDLASNIVGIIHGSLSTPVGKVVLATGASLAAATAFYNNIKRAKLSQIAMNTGNNPSITNESSSSSSSSNSSSSSSSSNSSFYTFTPEQRQQKMSDAKKNDRYDMNFLEAIQNTQMSYNRDTSAINSAYNDYLKDPEGFLTMDGKEFYRKYKMA